MEFINNHEELKEKLSEEIGRLKEKMNDVEGSLYENNYQINECHLNVM